MTPPRPAGPTVLVAGPDTVNADKAGLVARLREVAPGARFEVADSIRDGEGGLERAQVAIATERVTEPYASAPLGWLHLTTAGVERMAIPALHHAPFPITHKGEASAIPMAEHVLAHMLRFARRMDDYGVLQAQRRWVAQTEPPSSELRQLRGATVAVIGYGAVGRAVASRAAAFGMRVLAVRRRDGAVPDGVAGVVRLDRLGEALAQADFVVLSVALTEATRGLIDAAALRAMKPGGYLINVSRGGLVDEPALASALRAGTIAGAALDVFDAEPLVPASPLWETPGLVVTPHCSGVGPRLIEDSAEEIAHNLVRFLDGRPLLHLVDREQIPPPT